MVNNEAKAGDLGMLARLKQIEGMKKKNIDAPQVARNSDVARWSAKSGIV